MRTDAQGNAIGKRGNSMIVYFSQKTIDCQIPENILLAVRNTYSAFTVETAIDGTVTISVPEAEYAAAKKFREDVFSMLVEMRKENDVLAGKLARRHGF